MKETARRVRASCNPVLERPQSSHSLNCSCICPAVNLSLSQRPVAAQKEDPRSPETGQRLGTGGGFASKPGARSSRLDFGIRQIQAHLSPATFVLCGPGQTPLLSEHLSLSARRGKEVVDKVRRGQPVPRGLRCPPRGEWATQHRCCIGQLDGALVAWDVLPRTERATFQPLLLYKVFDV